MGLCPDLYVYTFGSEHIQCKEEHLTPVINKGYNIPRFQYNIITSARVQGSFQKSFDIENIDDAYMGILLAPKGLTGVNEACHVSSDDDGHKTREKLMEIYARSDLDLSNWNLKLDSSTGGSNDLILPIGQEFDDRFLGMACLKPHKGAYEITGFLSFYPKVGTLLMGFCDYWGFKKLETNEIWITAIHEHLLREMYERFGYEFLTKQLVPVSSGGAGHSDLLEDGIGASRDFHLDVMVKRRQS